jgi:acetyl-CoA acetyltransferase
MRDVFVAGAAMTGFGVFKGATVKTLGARAAMDAMKDAGVDAAAIEMVVCGTAAAGTLAPQGTTVPQVVMREVGVVGIPMLRVENACASGTTALHQAWLAIGAGAADVVLVLGVEKMTGAPRAKVFEYMASASDVELEGALGLTMPGVFAMIARRHMREFGTTREQIAAVAVKNHAHGGRNPRAHFRSPITVSDVLAAPMIARPLTLLDCCPVTDGAAAIVLASGPVAERLGRRQVKLAAVALRSGTYAEDLPLTGFDATVRAASDVYARAGIGPEDVDVAEVHDCFTIAEILHYEDLGFVKKGEGGLMIERGDSALGGRRPVNPSGGLKAKGHPVGATGVAQVVEITEQLRGQAGDRQVPGAKVGLTHCLGGFMHGDACAVGVSVLTR